MKKLNNKGKDYLYIAIAFLFGIIIGYFLISNLDITGNAPKINFTRELTESSPTLKKSIPIIDQLDIVGAPIANPGSGTYSLNQLVTLSSQTPEAIIKYTLDASEPTVNSNIYSTPFIITDSTVIKAKSYKAGFLTSQTRSFNYTINMVETPIVYQNLSQVSLSTTTIGATIRYTLDNSEPTESSNIYSTALTITGYPTIKAKAYKTSWLPSPTATFNYNLLGAVIIPTASQASGTVNFNSQVSLSTTTTGATIRYTLDSSEPTESSSIYSTPFTITGTTNIKAKAYKTGYQSSSTATFNYTINTVASPASIPTWSNVNYNSNIILDTSTIGAHIRYTINGTDPNEESSVYSTPFIIDNNITIKARAYKSYWQPSSIVTFNFTIQTVSTPSATPNEKYIAQPNNFITLQTTTPGANIYYTTNGSIPTQESALYTNAIIVVGQKTLKAKAFKIGYKPSDILSTDYYIYDPYPFIIIDGNANNPIYIYKHPILETWGCAHSGVGATGYDFNLGITNTNAIVNNCSERPIAASICHDFNGYGHTDWYLPSKDGITTITTYYQDINDGVYWSSTEIPNLAAKAWYRNAYYLEDPSDPIINGFAWTRKSTFQSVICVRNG